MERVKCIVAYDGLNFAGYQIQQNERTVQGELQKVLQKIHQEVIVVHASGRTDATVHAQGQVFHFDTPLSIPVEGWKRAFNTRLPKDVYIVSVEKVAPDFHARYSVVKKEYRYKVWNGQERDIFKRLYEYHYPYHAKVERMKEAASYLIGTHDFTSFCSSKTATDNRVRTIYEIDITRDGDDILFRFVGNGFLYNMIRIIVGTLLDIGQGRHAPLDIQDMLDEKRRSASGKKAPGHGLYLWHVSYDEKID